MGTKKEAGIYVIKAGNISVSVSDYGATVLGICVPAADGSARDVALGYDSFEAYAAGVCHYGGAIGRNGNRIANGRFELNGKTVQMPLNENGNNLHSGPDGFDFRIWEVEEQAEDAITFSMHSPDGDQGFPGSMDIRMTYRVSADGTFSLLYEAVSDEDTVFNMTNHSYFNLNGHENGTIYEHLLTLNGGSYSEVGEGLIPTGKHVDVTDTAFDFRTPHTIGERINEDDPQLKIAGGYDHNYFLDGTPGEYRQIGEAYSPESGIDMKIFTDLPCVQFYAGNFITEEPGKNGASYAPRSGFCLETQYCPDAVNHPEEQQPVIRAGQKASTRTAYVFSVREK